MNQCLTIFILPYICYKMTNQTKNVATVSLIENVANLLSRNFLFPMRRKEYRKTTLYRGLLMNKEICCKKNSNFPEVN